MTDNTRPDAYEVLCYAVVEFISNHPAIKDMDQDESAQIVINVLTSALSSLVSVVYCDDPDRIMQEIERRVMIVLSSRADYQGITVH